jgi:hypothetical protein
MHLNRIRGRKRLMPWFRLPKRANLIRSNILVCCIFFLFFFNFCFEQEALMPYETTKLSLSDVTLAFLPKVTKRSRLFWLVKRVFFVKKQKGNRWIEFL